MKGVLLIAGFLSATLALGAAAPDAGRLPFAHPLAVDAKPSSVKVKLGEPFQYTLQLTHLPTERYELRTPQDLGPFELSKTLRARKDDPSGSVTTFTLELSLFELEKHKLPDLVFDVTTPEGLKRFELVGTEVEAVSSLPADGQAQAELMDIKPPEEVPVPSYRLLYLLGGLLALGGLSFLLWRRLSRPKLVKPLPPPVVLPVHVRAENSLRALAAEKLPEQGRVREYYFRLSEILRAYLGERYGIEALECTSSELLDRVERLRAPELPREELRGFVLESDLVKFAKTVVAPEVCERALAFGHELVQKTRPPPPPSSPTTAPVKSLR